MCESIKFAGIYLWVPLKLNDSANKIIAPGKEERKGRTVPMFEHLGNAVALVWLALMVTVSHCANVSFDSHFSHILPRVI